MYPDEAGCKNGFPSGDGSIIFEMTVFSGNHRGDIVVGLDIEYFVDVQFYLLPFRVESNRVVTNG